MTVSPVDNSLTKLTSTLRSVVTSVARCMVYSLLAYLPYLVEFDPLFALLKNPLMWSQKINELAGNTNTLLSNPDNK